MTLQRTLLLITKSKATSLSMVTTTAEQMRSVYGSSRHSSTRSRRDTHIVILNQQRLSLQLHQTLFTVRLQVHFLTDVRQANHLLRVLHQATVQNRQVFSHHLTQLLRFLTNGLLTVSQILRQSTLMLSETTLKRELITS